MDIIGILDFPHQFIIKDDSDYDTANDKKPITICNKWCTDNCKGMWLITEKVAVSLYAPVHHESLMNHLKFPPAVTRQAQSFILSFQESDEAMAFKLMYSEESKKR